MNQKTYKLVFVIILISFVVFVFQSYRWLKYNDLKKLNQKQLNSNSKLDYVQTRDFMRYECKNMKRIGGPADYIKNSPHPLYRIDGAWFLCLDDQLDLKKNDCNILSFGINNDYSFDEIMNRDFGCYVFSFDPQIEAQLFSNIRAANKDLSQSVEIKVTPEWSFYKYEYII